MQNLFGRPPPNRFCIVSGHNPYLLTIYLCIFIMFLPYIYIRIQNILSKFWLFFLVYSFSLLFIVSYIISFSYSKQTTFSDHKNSFYSVSLHTYTEYLYAKICRSCSRNCMKRIWVVQPEYVLYSFSIMIGIFFPFLS